jgi:HSP20 family protein
VNPSNEPKESTMSDLSQSRNLAQPDTAVPATNNTANPAPALRPRVDVLEDDAGITLLADLPGVSRERLVLDVDGDTLRIEGEVVVPAPAQLNPVHTEVRVPRYRRAFTLSRELDSSRIEATLKDGVLQLRIPKQAHAQPRRIAVNAA